MADSDFNNDEDSWKKEIKIKYDPHDVEYWFNSVEAQMKKFGINRQWDKKDSILPLLPSEVIEECKPLLRLSEADAGNQIYKNLKVEILSLYGQRDEDAFKKAIALKMTGKPSGFGKKLIHIICPGSKPFASCHCARMVFGFWEAQLSAPIKTKLAGQKFNASTYQDLFKIADEAWLANGGSANPPSVVAAVAAENPTLTPESNPQVAAFNQRGRGQARGRAQTRGGRRGRGGRGSYNNTNQNQNSTPSTTQNKPHQKGPKHADLPNNASWACAQHWRKGRQAPYCSDPTVCQWNNIYVARA